MVKKVNMEDAQKRIFTLNFRIVKISGSIYLLLAPESKNTLILSHLTRFKRQVVIKFKRHYFRI